MDVKDRDMIEQLYADFNTRLLPAIQDGLQITQEYFIELFHRYITYLIVTDIITLVICSVLLVVFITAAWKLRTWAYNLMEDDYNPMGYFLIAVLATGSIVLFGMMLENTFDLVKVLYIPEVRIYEELQAYKSNNN